MDVLLWLKYLFLGMVQGITEPIPVSSSGHLVIVQELMGLKQEGLFFEVLTNTASLFAIAVIYRQDIARLISSTVKFILTREKEYRSDFMFSLYVVIGTIPAALAAVLLKSQIEQFFSSIHTVSISLLVTGVALWLIRNLRGRKRDGDLSVRDALLVGLAQAVALIPGISRSGATVISSMAVGMKQETALRFSFMLYIPISVGGIILSVSDLTQNPERASMAVPYVLAFAASLVTTYFSMKWLMNVMAKGNLKYFAYYCFAVGILLLFIL
ncbi:undecaprenyl-diphosphate phosphatase [Paenibacillus sp. F411]|uniref:Undecaprenyl-diphosphatase n=1 Tax=Paenibacillus algicola TaxID=2565926 RepID=A0A4P8XMJ5_9BACL|nr:MULTISPECIES: undecaprenyl-diphosphate phosphatase [Paenibacillus]MBO2942894.1 undecaprenyl-diphosphate phosphatase [Paenibacillus sp. F411]QCT02910.1 undecaprenyl pyrophosphate phosphatase [Paenibacillus algicola]